MENLIKYTKKKKSQKGQSNVNLANFPGSWTIQNYLYYYMLGINSLKLKFLNAIYHSTKLYEIITDKSDKRWRDLCTKNVQK